MGKAAAMMMMVMVVGRAFVTSVMTISRRGRFLMVIFAAVSGYLGANIDLDCVGTEGTGIQPGQRAYNHQPCQNCFHRSCVVVDAAPRKLKEKLAR